ncbi:class II aldolase/adducin family protein [Nitratireductor sp. GCM10026969]|uniref:class II aldolase/adducin family protein n=1 Tax=Nitratireductor sp. GCM10026969 TaxID=3252645 RepID=UPI00360FB128
MAIRDDTDFTAEFDALRALSARVGGDPLLVQAAGGNTSIKRDGTLWIKASGTWLANALSDDIFVPVAMTPLLDCVEKDDPAAEKAQSFVIAAENPSGLRPSIETTVHSAMPQRIVVHVHCVDTIAVAVRREAEAILEQRLKGMNWAFVPYARPGLPLAHAIRKRLRPGIDVLVLGNHGLVVAAETVADAAALLERVCARLGQPRREAPPADEKALKDLAAGSGYRLPQMAEAHTVATDGQSCRIAAGGSLYPDHVIFLGPGSVVAGEGETAADIAAAAKAAGLPEPASILFPGKGVVMREDASAGAEALARCLADVTARMGEDARPRYLSEEENAELLDWDAEKYRQMLDSRAAAGRT